MYLYRQVCGYGGWSGRQRRSQQRKAWPWGWADEDATGDLKGKFDFCSMYQYIIN
ncbi:hypothetical protein Lalb_Chr03g0026851 [Lupinus albus]|uniref:Uncharacterized protein n=1 Tax=Lupinus albus TaxID=3870 RepID=A0A6A4QSJ2_LUPAL|nr:hypothetical protein Lalb_Chr03g0026851 [Lupinus albus]